MLIVVQPLTPTNKRLLDELVDKLLVGQRSTARRGLPRSNFSHGFSNLTMVTADEWMGMLFTLLLVVSTERGAALFEKRFSQDNVDAEFIEHAFASIAASEEAQRVAGVRMDEQEVADYEAFLEEKRKAAEEARRKRRKKSAGQEAATAGDESEGG